MRFLIGDKVKLVRLHGLMSQPLKNRRGKVATIDALSEQNGQVRLHFADGATFWVRAEYIDYGDEREVKQ